MPKFTTEGSLENNTAGHFGFTAIGVDHLEASGYTLATIVCDRSGSTSGYQKPMEEALKSSIEALKKHPNNETMLVRVVTVDTQCEEQHGFIPVTDIDGSRYDGLLSARGVTALFDGCVNAAEAAANFGKTLIQQRYTANGIIIVITDGLNCAGKFSQPEDIVFVKDAFGKTTQTECLESLVSVLIGVVGKNIHVANELQKFHSEAGFSEPMITLTDANPTTIAKIGKFITDSVSSTSVARGTGGPSQSISFS